VQGTQKPISISGNAEAGRTLFWKKARCAECHSISGKGGFLASDLSGYGKTHSPEEVRQQVLHHEGDESRTITWVTTRQGRKYEGLVRNEDNFSLQLQTFDGDFLFLRKAELAVVEHEEIHPNLANGGAKLSPRDFNDLTSYLSRTAETGSSATAAAPK
jgi:putative heme-binding domain-containing protein